MNVFLFCMSVPVTQKIRHHWQKKKEHFYVFQSDGRKTVAVEIWRLKSQTQISQLLIFCRWTDFFLIFIEFVSKVSDAKNVCILL